MKKTSLTPYLALLIAGFFVPADVKAGLFSNLFKRPESVCNTKIASLSRPSEKKPNSENKLNDELNLRKSLGMLFQKSASREGLEFNSAEIEILTLENKGQKEEARQLKLKLAGLYQKNNRLQEAIWTFESAGENQRARDLQGELSQILSNSPIKFIKRLDDEKFANEKVHGKTEVWLVELKGGLKAVYKPEAKFWADQKKAQWQIEIQRGTSISEVSAAEDDALLKTQTVATTVYRENIQNPQGILTSGSLQYFFNDALPMHGYEVAEILWPGQRVTEKWIAGGTPKTSEVQLWNKLVTGNMRFLAYIVSNDDLHAANFLIIPGGRRVSLDHALAYGAGNSRRWALEPNASNISDFIPSPEVLARARAMSDEEFANNLRRSKNRTESQIAEMVKRRAKLLKLLEKVASPAIESVADEKLESKIEPSDASKTDFMSKMIQNLEGPKEQLILFEKLFTIGQEASKLALSRHTQSDLKIWLKADHSRVTDADISVSDLMVKTLSNSFRDIPVISEERPAPSYEIRKNWKRFFIVDPIDSTSNFILGNDEFTLNMALIEDGHPTAGVVVAPAKKIMYFGIKGVGSFKYDWNGAPSTLTRIVAQGGFNTHKILVSRSHMSSDKYNRYFSQRQIDLNRVEGIGSSIKFALVAEGSAPTYLRLSEQNEWDVAAGDAVYRYATLDQSENHSPFVYNTQDLTVPPFVIGQSLD